jgi:pimeloyl-ACP methyl ester carboxylesterase
MRRLVLAATCLGLTAQVGCAAKTESITQPVAASPPLLQSDTASVAEVCTTGATRAWTVLDQDQPVAITRGGCLGLEPEGWHFVTELSAPDAWRPDYELHFWLDDDAHPLRAQMRTGLATAYYAWTPTSLTIELYGDRHEISFDEPRHDVWVVPAHALYLREVMLRLGVGRDDEAGDDSILQLGFSPEIGDVVPLPFHEKDGALVVGDEGIARFVLTPQTERLADVALLEVFAGEQAIYRQRADDRPILPTLPEVPAPEYIAADELAIEKVSIPQKGAAPSLAGEIVQTADGPQQRPAVVFVSGSGPQDRYGFVPGTSIDIGSHQLHDALARAGFAVLRYDDRGVGDSELGDDVTPGFRAQVDDARRAIEFVKDRPEVDSKKVIVIGHGEGALATSIVAGESKSRLAGAVLISPAARDARELIYWQMSRAMTGQDPARIESAIGKAKQIHAAAVADKDLPAASEPMRDWMQEIFKEDPLLRLRKVRAPVLAIAGDKDFQTDAELDFRAVADALQKHGRKGSESKLFVGLDHLLKPEPGDSTVGHYGDLTRRVDPNALSFLSDWCRQRVGL